MKQIQSTPVAFITGASKRIGRQIAIELHQAGFNVAVHYHHSVKQATELAKKLNCDREGSCEIFQADITQTQQLSPLIKSVIAKWQRLDLLINNASSFYPTPVSETEQQNHWDNLLGTNLKAPYFLSIAAIPALKKSQGSIINIVDIYALQPLLNHSIYSIAKAGLVMMTKSLATELAGDIRVNGVAPGAILWPENNTQEDSSKQKKIIQKTALKRQGSAEDIAKVVRFLALDADYITGQIIKVDGGRF